LRDRIEPEKMGFVERLLFNVPSSQENPESDPYADYPVPDDLMW